MDPQSKSDSSTEFLLSLHKLRELAPFPLVRYIPSVQGPFSETDDWEDSDLVDVLLEDHNSRCYFCLEDYRPPQRRSACATKTTSTEDPLTQFPCGHVLHQLCANAWMKENSRCFLCKIQLPYPPAAVQNGNGWSVVSSLARDRGGLVRRDANVQVELLRAFECEDTRSAMFSADGHYFTLEGTNALHVFETRTISVICTIECIDLADSYISSNGKILVSGDKDGNMKVWSIDATQRNAKVINSLHHDGFDRVKIIGEDRSILSLSSDHILQVWDVATGDALQNMSIHSDSSADVTCAIHHGSYVAVGMADGMLELFDIESGTRLNSWRAHADAVRSVRFTPDGRKVLSAGEDRLIAFWDVSIMLEKRLSSTAESSSSDDRNVDTTAPWVTGKVNELSVHDGLVWQLAVLGGGRWVASCHSDGNICFWDVHTGAPQCVLQFDHFRYAAFSPADDIFLTCGEGGLVQMWRYGTSNDTQVASTAQPTGPDSFGPTSSHTRKPRFAARLRDFVAAISSSSRRIP